MFVFRAVLLLAALVLGGLVVAWMATGNRRYLAIAGQLLFWTLAFAVLLGLLYVFERVVLMKGAQTGGTEAGLNWLGYIIQNAPGIVMLVQPSLDMVRRNTTVRIDPLIEATPTLRELVASPRSRDRSASAHVPDRPPPPWPGASSARLRGCRPA